MILDYEKIFNDADFGIGNGIGLCKLQCKCLATMATIL